MIAVLQCLYKNALVQLKVFALAACLLPLCASAQFYHFRNYNVKDGLPSSEVYVCMQDSDGYMWFSTDMGVSRFNGYEFKNFSTENGLADNNIYGIYQDHQKRIWFRSLSGKLTYYAEGRMHTLACNPRLEVIFGNIPCTSIYVDHGDTIWMGANGPFILKIAPGWKEADISVIRFPKLEKHILLVDDSGFVFGGNSVNSTMSVYNRWGQKLYTTDFGTGNTGILSLRYDVIRLSDGTFLASVNNALIHFKGQEILHRVSEQANVICMIEDRQKHIFIGTYNGALIYADQTFHESKPVERLSHKVVPYMCEDHEGGRWYCTEGQGVYYLPFSNFMYYTPEDGLSENKLSCIEKCGNQLMVGHLGKSLTILDKQQIRSVSDDQNLNPVVTNNRINALKYDEKHQSLYIGTQDEIYAMDVKTYRMKRLPVISGAKKILLDRDGYVQLLAFGSLISYDPARNFKEIKMMSLHFFSDNAFKDSKGDIYISSLKGLWSYHDSTPLNSTVLRFLGDRDSLLRSRVVAIREAPDGALWMATRGNGVIIKKGALLFHIKQENGLSGNMCRAIYIDSVHNIWVGTNSGLNRITPGKGPGFTYSIVTYTSKNGLLTNEVNGILSYSGKLLLMHNNGISVFDPQNIKNNTSPPPVYILRTLVNGAAYSLDSTQTLAYNQNYISIYYIGLSYKDAGNLEYKYKMEGIDSAWVYTHYTSVKYQTIPPGTYRFIVYARNNDGYWSTQPAMISFSILPAWWQTWWFKLLSGLLILAMVILAFVIRLNAFKKRERERSALQSRIRDTELQALRAQMSPHFIFNAMNSVQYFITRHDPVSSQKYLSKFARLIRYVVDNSKLTTIPLEKELEALHLYLDLEALRFETHFEYEISVAENVDVSFTQVPSMLIQPYIENAIWHGLMHKQGKGKIILRMEMDGDILKCTIEDNGIGRKRSAELKLKQGISTHQSQGMSITRERLEMINQVNQASLTLVITDLEDEAGGPLGTRVELTIPAY